MCDYIASGYGAYRYPGNRGYAKSELTYLFLHEFKDIHIQVLLSPQYIDQILDGRIIRSYAAHGSQTWAPRFFENPSSRLLNK